MANNYGMPTPPAGVTPAQLGQNAGQTALGKKPFLKTTGGKIATGVLTGGLGLLATGAFGKSKLTRQMDEAMKNIQGLGLSPEMQTAYQQSQALAGQGMDAASKQLAIQEGARMQAAGLGALRSKRSLLAGAPGLYASSNDMALRLAAQDAMMKRENQMMGIQTGMQFGQAQSELQKYKTEAIYNELAAKKARRAQTLSGILGAAGSIAGAALAGGGK
jgi:hypothetical protein